MPNWEGSTRKDRLPDNWRELRRKVAMRAAFRCQGIVDGQRCDRPGSHCDHIQRGDDHSLDNLQWLCPDCHNRKSGREGALARPPLRRPTEAHPGLKVSFQAPPRPSGVGPTR